MTSFSQNNKFLFIARLDKKLLSVLILSFVFLIYFGDYLIGPLTPFTHFYLIPIIIATLFLDSTSAILVAILSTILATPYLQEAEANYTTLELWFNLFSDGTIFFTVLLLTSNIKKLLKKLDIQANFDLLTNVYSRNFFNEVGNLVLANSFREKLPVVVVYIDIDNFTEVNESFGRQVGDNLLLEVATSIKSSLRDGDLLGRQGVDKFTILLQNISKEQADVLIHQIKENLISSIAHFNSKATFSFALVIYNGDKKTSIDKLLALADSSMQSIKNSTKNSIRYAYA
jgi:diguanylate cyclase (GGDEF)-like protein